MADEDKLAVICDGRARNRSHQSGDSIELLTTNHSAHNKGFVDDMADVGLKRSQYHAVENDDEALPYDKLELSNANDSLDNSDSTQHFTADTQERETWSNKFDFLLSIIGFAVDLANVWRFPYYCYKNGGGAFLIPYFLMLFLGAAPLFYMELLLGQFHKQGAISLWKIVPIFKGVGWTIVTVSYLVSFYYNTVIAWSIYYFFSSFTTKLPWTTCDNDWNTCDCWTGEAISNYSEYINTSSTAIKLGCYNMTMQSLTDNSTVGPTTEYFERKMLRVNESSGLGDLGTLSWQVTLCLLLAYIIIYFAIWRGVKTSGKVVYVTAVMPYVILLILLIRGLFLEGATKGLFYFANPTIHRLADPEVWIDAAFQVFYSVGAGFGVHLAMASYNKFDNNCYMDCLVTAGVNSFTSLFSGCTVFVYLGYMSVTMQKPIETVASKGPSLVFEVYPQAISTIPGSTAWSLLFFFMLIMLGMDSAMGGLESVCTGIIDEFSGFFKKYKWHREIFVGVVVFISFLCSLASVTNGGFFVLTLLDNFAAGTSLLLVVFFEAVAIGWFYGLDQFLADAKVMLGFTPGLYWRICWKFISPVFLMGIVIANCVTYEPLKAELSNRTIVYPVWGNILGWMFVICAFLWVPGYAIYTLLCKYKDGRTWKERLAMAISPEQEHKSIRNGKQIRRFQLDHWTSIGSRSDDPQLIRCLPSDRTAETMIAPDTEPAEELEKC